MINNSLIKCASKFDHYIFIKYDLYVSTYYKYSVNSINLSFTVNLPIGLGGREGAAHPSMMLR